MGKLLRDTKQFYYNFMLYDDTKGDYFISNAKAEEEYKLTAAEWHFMKNYMALIMGTNIVSESTKEFIRINTLDSTRKVVEILVKESKKKKNSKELNFNTVLAMIQYDEKKLLKFFAVDMLEKIKSSSYKDISVYQAGLNNAVAQHGKANELKDKLALHIPLTELSDKLSDSDFKVLLEMIKPYSKEVMRQVIENIPERMLSYLNFLMYVEDKGSVDNERYQKLKRLLENGLTQVELSEIQNKFEQPTAKKETPQKEFIGKPKVEPTDADIKRNSQLVIEETKKEMVLEYDEPGDEYIAGVHEPLFVEDEDELIDLDTPEPQEEEEVYPIVYDMGGGYYKVIKFKGDEPLSNTNETKFKALYPNFDMSKIKPWKKK